MCRTVTDQPDAPDQGDARGEQTEPQGSRKKPSLNPLVRSGFMEYDRVVFFSDAVFAIAITLLAVNLRVPEHILDAGNQLRHTVPQIRGFAISFAVIALFWVGHHGIFRYINALDRTLILLNLLFLGSIAFLPYPTDLFSATGSSQAAAIFYATCVAFAGLCETAIWVYAISSPAGLTNPATDSVRRLYLLRIIRVPAVFLLSIPITFWSVTAAEYSWILIFLTGAALNRFAPHLDPVERID